jgi:hypothetical protein
MKQPFWSNEGDCLRDNTFPIIELNKRQLLKFESKLLKIRQILSI